MELIASGSSDDTMTFTNVIRWLVPVFTPDADTDAVSNHNIMLCDKIISGLIDFKTHFRYWILSIKAYKWDVDCQILLMN